MPSQRSKTDDEKPKNALRVIIVGGSITGLTLAHSLHHNNIDYVLLEARKDLAPTIGASIVILSNGAILLDQLGVYDEVLEVSHPVSYGYTWNKDGKLLFNTDGPLLLANRMGYAPGALKRQHLLRILSDRIQEKERIHTSKRVNLIKQSEHEVVVRCEDGTSYTGDIVVGADGIHSTVRTMMQQHIEEQHPGKADKDKDSITAEYNCIWGLGPPVEGDLKPGQMHKTYMDGQSTLVFVGKDLSLFWFTFSKLAEKVSGKNIPRYTDADVTEAMKPFLKLPVSKLVNFEKLWNTRTSAGMTVTEESKNENWSSDRIVCIGDSIHKMTPNAGYGGNCAIESAVALANHLATLSGPTRPSLDEVRNILHKFYKERHERVDKTVKEANELTRIESFATLKFKFMVHFVIPIIYPMLLTKASNTVQRVELLKALPAPPRALTATMPWHKNGHLVPKERKLIRALYAMPLLLATYYCHRTMGATIEALVVPKTPTGILDLGRGLLSPIWNNYFGVKGLDNFISIFVGFFTPIIGNFDPIARLQAIAFLGDLIPIQTIWMIESIRRGNYGTAAQVLPTILGVLFQLKGIGHIAPIYYFLHYAQCSLKNLAAADNRMVQSGPIKTIIPTIVLSYVVPSIVMFAAPGLATRQWINGLFWQPFPIYASILQRILPKLVKDTTEVDKFSRTEADMPYLRAAYGFAAAAAACAYLYVRITSPVSMFKLFFDGLANPTEALPLIRGATKALKYDQIACFGASAYWVLLSFGDLKKAGKLQAGWGRVLGVFAGATLAAGPGAATAIMWAWREERLARRETRKKEE